MINVDFTNIDNTKLVGRLLPFWARGRRMNLFLQAVLSPLITVHDKFKKWALERYIECHITSQAMSLQWYLKYRLHTHFLNEDSIFYIAPSYNDVYACFSVGDWNNDLLWHNTMVWQNKNETGIEIDTSLNSDKVINMVAPAIVETLNYNKEDYERDIRNIMSKYMINFNKINVIISDE